MVPDPEQPSGIAGPWRYASLVDDPFEAGIWEAPVDSWREDGYPVDEFIVCLLYTSPSPRDGLLSRMPSSA